MFKIDIAITIIINRATGITVSSLLLGLIMESLRPPVLIMA
jgi:large-conductance mechanosensitive channel